jgi:hypothetical protein
MNGSDDSPLHLTPRQLQDAFELGGDHAEDGITRILDPVALWGLIIDDGLKHFSPDAPIALIHSYQSGHLHLS